MLSCKEGSLLQHCMGDVWSQRGCSTFSTKALLGLQPWADTEWCFCCSTHLYHPFKGDLDLKRIAPLAQNCALQWFTMPRSHHVLSRLCPSSVRPLLGPASAQNMEWIHTEKCFHASVSEKQDRAAEWHSDSPWRLCFFN